MSGHGSQAFSIAHCTDSEDLPPLLQQILAMPLLGLVGLGLVGLWLVGLGLMDLRNGGPQALQCLLRGFNLT